MKKLLSACFILILVFSFIGCDLLLSSKGTVEGEVINGTTGDGLSGVTVQSGTYSTTTNSEGSFTLKVPSGVQTFSFTKTGYNIASLNVVVFSGEIYTIPPSDIVANPVITNSNTWRIVLTWGSTPYDLDSHLKTPNGDHIYYNFSAAGTALLDVDDTSSYGPETITIDPVSTTGTYKYYVHNFSGSPDITTSAAIVKLYNSSGLYRTYNVPTSGTGRYWNVFEIVNRSIVTKNTIQSSAP